MDKGNPITSKFVDADSFLIIPFNLSRFPSGRVLFSLSFNFPFKLNNLLDMVVYNDGILRYSAVSNGYVNIF